MAIRPLPNFSGHRNGYRRKKKEIPIPLHKRDQGYVWDDDCEENFKAFLSQEREIVEHMNLTTTQNSDANELAKTIKESI